MNWLSIGTRHFYVRLSVYWWRASMESKLVMCFIHWLLISYYYDILGIKSRTGRRLYLLYKGSFSSHLHCQIYKNKQFWNIFALIGQARFGPLVTSGVQNVMCIVWIQYITSEGKKCNMANLIGCFPVEAADSVIRASAIIWIMPVTPWYD